MAQKTTLEALLTKAHQEYAEFLAGEGDPVLSVAEVLRRWDSLPAPTGGHAKNLRQFLSEMVNRGLLTGEEVELQDVFSDAISDRSFSLPKGFVTRHSAQAARMRAASSTGGKPLALTRDQREFLQKHPAMQVLADAFYGGPATEPKVRSFWNAISGKKLGSSGKTVSAALWDTFRGLGSEDSDTYARAVDELDNVVETLASKGKWTGLATPSEDFRGMASMDSPSRTTLVDSIDEAVKGFKVPDVEAGTSGKIRVSATPEGTRAVFEPKGGTAATPAATPTAAAEGIKNAFSQMGQGIKEGARAKAREYAARILAGEDQAKILAGHGPAWQKSILEELEVLKKGGTGAAATPSSPQGPVASPTPTPTATAEAPAAAGAPPQSIDDWIASKKGSVITDADLRTFMNGGRRDDRAKAFKSLIAEGKLDPKPMQGGGYRVYTDEEIAAKAAADAAAKQKAGLTPEGTVAKKKMDPAKLAESITGRVGRRAAKGPEALATKMASRPAWEKGAEKYMARLQAEMPGSVKGDAAQLRYALERLAADAERLNDPGAKAAAENLRKLARTAEAEVLKNPKLVSEVAAATAAGTQPGAIERLVRNVFFTETPEGTPAVPLGKGAAKALGAEGATVSPETAEALGKAGMKGSSAKRQTWKNRLGVGKGPGGVAGNIGKAVGFLGAAMAAKGLYDAAVTSPNEVSAIRERNLYPTAEGLKSIKTAEQLVADLDRQEAVAKRQQSMQRNDPELYGQVVSLLARGAHEEGYVDPRAGLTPNEFRIGGPKQPKRSPEETQETVLSGFDQLVAESL